MLNRGVAYNRKGFCLCRRKTAASADSGQHKHNPFQQLFHRKGSRGCGSSECGGVETLHHGISHCETARFLHVHLILYRIITLTKTVYVEDVAGIARSRVITYVIIPVVSVAGGGTCRLNCGGTHVNKLQILQVTVCREVKAYPKTVTYMEFHTGFNLLKTVAVSTVHHPQYGAFECHSVLLLLNLVKFLSK